MGGAEAFFFPFPAHHLGPCPLGHGWDFARLIGLIQHIGSMGGGHYIAYCQHKRKAQEFWWKKHLMMFSRIPDSTIGCPKSKQGFMEDFWEGSWHFERNVCVVLVYWSSHVILGPDLMALRSAGLVRV